MNNKKIIIKSVWLVTVCLFFVLSFYIPPIEAGVTTSGIKPFPNIPRYNLDKLIDNRYSKIVARARDNDLKATHEALFSFERDLEGNFIEMFECNRCDKVQNYNNIIKNNVLFLIENDEFTSVPALWNEISLMINVPYKRWNKKYNKLQKDLKEGEKDYQIYYESITFEETRFVKTFHAVKQLLKQITETDSPDFVFHERDD